MHRHRSFPTTVLLARVGSRLQPTTRRTIRESNMCFIILPWCEFDARQRSANQRLHVRAPLLALKSPSSRMFVPQPQHPKMAEWTESPPRSMTGTERKQARFPKEAAGPESSGDELGILVDDPCIDTGAFRKRHLLHELVFACSQPLPRLPQISYTILFQAD